MKINLSTDVVNQLTLVGAAAIIILTVVVAGKYIKQIKNDTASGELSEENWDGIGEYKNSLPLGWALSYVGTMIWAIWYWLFSPYAVNAYSQIGEYNQEVKQYNATFEKKWANPSADTLMGMGEGFYLVNCAPCHGIAGDGIDGKAQGFDKRMTKAQVLTVIKNGQNQLHYAMGPMPAGMASGADADAIATWIAGGMKGEQPKAFATCAGCHGADGKGNGGTAPNLAEYGNVLVKHVLENGKKGSIGTMPSFKGRFTDVQKKAVATYLRSLQEK